jgi:hypothetical protein
MTPHQVADELTTTVERAVAQLRALDAQVLSHRPAPDRWTIKQVIGHLIDSAANNHQRFVRAQFVGAAATGAEFRFPKYEQNQWVNSQGYDEILWSDLLELWRRYNLHLAHVIRHIPAHALSVRCMIGDYAPMTLASLIEDYLVHLQHHLAKIAERAAAVPRSEI